MGELEIAERETHLNMTGDDHDTWIVYSDDPYMMRKLDKIAEFVKRVGWGKEYKLRAEQVTFRTGKNRVSDERRVELADHMRRVRKTQVIT